MMNFNDDWIIKSKLPQKFIEQIISVCDYTVVNNNLISDTDGKSPVGDMNQYALYGIFDSKTLTEISNIVKQCLIDNDIITNDVSLNNISLWTVSGKEGSFHAVHNHNNLIPKKEYSVSTVIYLKVPEKESSSINGNFYAFFKSNDVISLSPEVGSIFIFPIWMYHGTYPQSKGLRQTLNLDFDLVINK